VGGKDGAASDQHLRGPRAGRGRVSLARRGQLRC
jgi:hypothetical protein